MRHDRASVLDETLNPLMGSVAAMNVVPLGRIAIRLLGLGSRRMDVLDHARRSVLAGSWGFLGEPSLVRVGREMEETSMRTDSGEG